MKRMYCVYCEWQDGIRTEMVPYAHWRLCPIHSKDFISKVMAPTELPEGAMWIPYSRIPGRHPLLKDVGVPGWHNRVQEDDII